MRSANQYKGIFGKGLDYLKGALFYTGAGLTALGGCTNYSHMIVGSENEGKKSAIVNTNCDITGMNDDSFRSSIMGEEGKITTDVEYKRAFDATEPFHHKYPILKLNSSFTGSVDEYDSDTSLVLNYPSEGSVGKNTKSQLFIPGLTYTRDLTRGVDSFLEAKTTLETDSETWGLNLLWIYGGTRLDLSHSSGDILIKSKTEFAGEVIEDLEDRVEENHFSMTADFRNKVGNVLVDVSNTYGDGIESTTSFSVGGSYNFRDDLSLGAVINSGVIQSEGEVENNSATVVLGKGNHVSRTIMDYLRSKRASLGWYSTHTDLLHDSCLMFDKNNVVEDANRKNRSYIIMDKVDGEELGVRLLNVHSFDSAGDAKYTMKLIGGVSLGRRKIGGELGIVIKEKRKR